MIAMNSSWRETMTKTAVGLALAIPALMYFTWQREGVLMAAFCTVCAINLFCLAAMRMSWTTYLNLAVIAPLILFGSFVGLSTAPCMIEGVATQSALFVSYSVGAMFPTAVPALVYYTASNLMDHYPLPDLKIDLFPAPAQKPAMAYARFPNGRR
ncbi:hypothetical protein [Pseudobacteriovorax antillogorgiicola]|uniref:Uncharacterized protein n=1 Tax=Pseudobacteriovorax antillogorgiicola TaxID=1513793 RepID=A0A1Y6CK04_9BACT|nr:hypothetical protein [Pseudobacteriovorax antillogorgiicola]TCS46363.1 hypothetical protein EDD56_12427 [Pseudobacteriovorax antillogorgiicola]SMF68446.1 hypothetical protein SAMN06296036_12427 [Pseudobacteriovorax antillogorgiicola]